MLKKNKTHPIIYNYLKKYQEDPGSRVFAPLAEAYRKVGLVDEAIEIAREGLKIHPGFVGGRVALSRALYDKQDYIQVIEELKTVIHDVPDNLVAQRLFADSHLMLGHVAQALSSYKMLLYFYPGDQETAQMVQELETQAYQRGMLVLQTDLSKPEEKEQIKNKDTASRHERAAKRLIWIQRIESLQGLLQKVEKYRTRLELTEKIN